MHFIDLLIPRKIFSSVGSALELNTSKALPIYNVFIQMSISLATHRKQFGKVSTCRSPLYRALFNEFKLNERSTGKQTVQWVRL